jgi:hypothetical protein
MGYCRTHETPTDPLSLLAIPSPPKGADDSGEDMIVERIKVWCRLVPSSPSLFLRLITERRSLSSLPPWLDRSSSSRHPVGAGTAQTGRPPPTDSVGGPAAGQKVATQRTANMQGGNDKSTPPATSPITACHRPQSRAMPTGVWAQDHGGQGTVHTGSGPAPISVGRGRPLARGRGRKPFCGRACPRSGHF